MTRAVAAAVPSSDTPRAGAALVTGIVLAALTEAVAGTALSLGRADVMGDIAATPDEFAWLDIAYITLKLVGFLVAPWMMGRANPRSLLVLGVLAMGVACGVAAITASTDLLVALRALQGFAGGVLLVVGQALLFLAYPRTRQPALQALFAVGSVVAPATLAPALQGWLLDTQSWTWIFLGVVPVAMAAAGLLLLADAPLPQSGQAGALDATGLLLVSVAFFCLTYVLSQGSRWDWFEAPRIVWLTLTGAAALLAFLGQQLLGKGERLLDFSVFGTDDFAFAFVVSFVAGAALFGSAYLIPAFALSVLAFAPIDAGLLLLPSSAMFVGALALAAFLFQVRRVPPFATVPFGIGLIMAAMWMLSGSSSQTGADGMMTAVLLRGMGLGFLFLSITLIAFSRLDDRQLATGIGLFNAGRQLGGLMGVAALQRLIDHEVVGNLSVLGANLTSGMPAVAERLASGAAALADRGLDAAVAGRAATGLLGRSMAGQATVIAFDAAFVAVALLFVVAAPVLVGIKIGFARRANARVLRGSSLPQGGGG